MWHSSRGMYEKMFLFLISFPKNSGHLAQFSGMSSRNGGKAVVVGENKWRIIESLVGGRGRRHQSGGFNFGVTIVGIMVTPIALNASLGLGHLYSTRPTLSNNYRVVLNFEILQTLRASPVKLVNLKTAYPRFH